MWVTFVDKMDSACRSSSYSPNIPLSISIHGWETDKPRAAVYSQYSGNQPAISQSKIPTSWPSGPTRIFLGRRSL